MTDLKNCPFCGARMVQHEKYPEEYSHEYRRGVRCPIGGYALYITDAPAVQAWNRREPPKIDLLGPDIDFG